MTTNLHFPKQRLTEKEKLADDSAWGKNMVDHLIQNSYSLTGGNVNNPKYQEMLSNYRLYNNILDQRDFERECNPLGLTVGEFKDEIRPYNKTYNKIQVLLGEELKRPFDYRTVVVDTDSIRTKFLEQDMLVGDFIKNTVGKFTQIISDYTKKVEQVQQDPTLSPEEMQAVEQQMQEKINAEIDRIFSEEQLSSFNNNNFITAKEQAASKLLKYLERKLDLPSRKNDNFKHALIAGEEITWVGIENGEPVAKPVNPISFFHHKPNDKKFYEDGMVAGCSNLMSTGEVINTFSDLMAEKDLMKFEESLHGWEGARSNKGMVYPRNSAVEKAYERLHTENRYHGQYGTNDHFLGEEIEVHHVEWRSMRKVYFKKFLNSYGDEELDLLSEDYMIPKNATKSAYYNEYGKKKLIYTVEEEGYTLEENWIDDIWQGFKVGDCYAGVTRKPYQFRSIDNPFDVKLGYHGVGFSNTNAPNISLMSRMKPFQYLYFIIAHKLKSFIAQDRAPLVPFDTSMIDPKIGLEKTLYYMDQLNINFFNPLENAESAGSHQRGSVSGSIDRTTMQYINNYIGVLQAIDQEISDVAGVSKQREGGTSANETATASQQAIIQSSHITEIYFDTHAKHWEKVLNSLIQVAQECWKEKGFIKQYVLDDMSVATLEITPDLLTNSDLGIFVSNSRKDNEIFNEIKALAQFALNSQQAKLSDIIRMYKETSSVGLEKVFKESEKKMIELAQQQAEQAQQAQAEQAKAEMEKLQLEHDFDMELEQLKIEAEYKLKEMDVFKFQKELDMNNNQVPDHLEVEKLRQERDMGDKELAFKEKELEVKSKLEEKKINKTTTSK